MDEKVKLCIIRSDSWQDVQEGRVEAWSADLPVPTDSLTLKLKGPHRNILSSGEKPDSNVGAYPIYDFQRQQVLWSCLTTSFSLWRMDRYFHLAKMEPLIDEKADKAKPWDQQYGHRIGRLRLNPSVAIIDGKVVMLVALDNGHHMARQDAEGWKLSNLATQWGDWKVYNPRLYQCQSHALDYLYTVGIVASRNREIGLSTIRFGSFQDARSADATLRWHHMGIQVDYELDNQDIAAIALPEKQTGLYRLHLFSFARDGSGIDYCWIPLRRDGSVDSLDPRMQGKNHQKLAFNLPDLRESLHVFAANNQISLLWHHPKTSERLIWFVGAIRDDGSCPESHQWQRVKHQHQDNASASSLSFFATTVADNYFA